MVLFGSAPGSAAAQCAGDCDRSGGVAVNELVTAVSIALGEATLAQCGAADVDRNGRVSIDELVTAVDRALNGCGPRAQAELMASANAAVEPLDGIYDYGSVGAGGVSGAAGVAAAAGHPAGFSGCETFPCVLFGAQTGSEEICCFGTEYTVTDSGCSFDDGLGNVIDRDGFVSLASDTADVCSGVIPVGEGFTLKYDAFFSGTTGAAGDFTTSDSTFTETYDPARAPGCTAQQPDRFGLGVRGDGVRTLDGRTRMIAGDGQGNITTDLATETHDLQIRIASLVNESQQCSVGAQLDGAAQSTDFISRGQFATSYDGFRVFELPDPDGTLYLDYEGTVGTDCLGPVDVTTEDFLQLRPGDACLTAGRLRVDLRQGTTAVEYTDSGGIAYDFGADGSIDEQLASCLDLRVEVCRADEITGLCAPCDGPADCAEDLDCFDCSFDCRGEQPRCSLPDDYATCEDGVF